MDTNDYIYVKGSVFSNTYIFSKNTGDPRLMQISLLQISLLQISLLQISLLQFFKTFQIFS